ncbi:MAG: hypothetical protein QM528_05565 [Phycisphaerales bacterium]|nr:hypothetical protein [Phycisphaerales bacterium]
MKQKLASLGQIFGRYDLKKNELKDMTGGNSCTGFLGSCIWNASTGNTNQYCLRSDGQYVCCDCDITNTGKWNCSSVTCSAGSAPTAVCGTFCTGISMTK